ncbi:MAG: tetratricopeptide repeat protein [Acidobacteria bacterium]|nr:tetratricopeptide repeat protein [Acidobacteriota bacterium]
MKNTNLLRAAGLLLLAAFFLITANASPLQKTSEADKQAQKGAEYLSKRDWQRAAESYQKAVRADARHVEANYGLGVAYMNLRRLDEALAAFAVVVAAQPNPRAREALVNTGAVQYSKGNAKEATDALAQAAALGDIGAPGHYVLGKSYQQLGRDAEALASLKLAAADTQYARDAPQYAQDALLSVGVLLMKQNRAREAVAPLEQAVKMNGQNAAAQALLGNAYVAADRPEEGLAALRAAAALDAKLFATQFGLGYAHLSLGHNEEAVAAFTAALRLEPTSPEAFVGLGNAYTRMLRYREADDAFARALALKSDSAEALMGQAVLQYYQGQYALLVETAQRAARAAPQSAAAQTLLGASLATTGDMAGGLRATQAAARLEPENYWPHQVLGFIHVREDRPKEALTEARTAVRIKPGDAGAQNLLAYVLNQLGQHAEALQAAQAALANKHEPADEGWAYYNVATAQEKLNRAEEAKAAYTASIRAYNQGGRTLDPDDLYLMGNAYLRLDNDAAAVKAFQQAIKVRPDFPQARYNLGVAYFALGNRKGAQDEYNALRRLDPARAAKLQAIISGRK